jgi:transposase
MHPHDPDSRVTKMKDGRTHLAHKAEHAVDLDSGALLAVTLPAADLGDTTTLRDTFNEAQKRLQMITQASAPEIVADKGYHSDAVLEEMDELGIRTYIAEPDRGRRKWGGKVAEQRRLHGNRRRLRGARSKRLHRKRAELTERTFAHMYETGGMRRLYLRGSQNILKRLLVHGAAFNLGLVMRKRHGRGKPRRPKEPISARILLIFAPIVHFDAMLSSFRPIRRQLGRPLLHSVLYPEALTTA